jgi:hypothetical protein
MTLVKDAAMPFSGAFHITGSGPRNSSVELLSDDGVVVGSAKADACGEFRIEGIDLGDGTHSLRAVCTRPSGSIVESPEIVVEVEAAGEPESSLSLAEQLELAHLRSENEHRTAELRAAAEDRYVELVLAMADGFEIDVDLGEMVLEASGRSTDDFARDVNELMTLRRKAEFAEQIAALRVDALRRRHQGDEY